MKYIITNDLLDMKSYEKDRDNPRVASNLTSTELINTRVV